MEEKELLRNNNKGQVHGPGTGLGVGECGKELPVKGTPEEAVSPRKNQLQLQGWFSALAAHLINRLGR